MDNMVQSTKRIKIIAHALFRLLAFVPYAVYKFCLIFWNKDRIFTTMSQTLSLFPGTMGSYLRVAFYCYSMKKCYQSCEIGFLSTFASSNISIGENTIISICANIGRADIGSDCLIGSYVMITAGKCQHRFDLRDKPIRLQGGEFHRVSIGRDCWIGNGAIVMADVGEGSVIAAGSVVTKPIPPYSIAVGSPAKVIGERGCDPV